VVLAAGYKARMLRRARLAVLAPDLVKGVHAAVATIVPFYLAGELGHPSLAWVALGGWLGALADPGGPRRTRVTAAAAFIVLGGSAVAIAHVASATTPTAALVLGAIVFAASLAPALGSNVGALGTTIAISAAVAAARAGSPRDGALFAAGATWAALTSMVMWPVWPHLPLRLAAGKVFERLADYVDAIAAAGPDDWSEIARTHQRAVRAALETARETALALRARRSGESEVGASLRVVLGAAEASFFRVIALAEDVERGGKVPAGLAPRFRATARDLYTVRSRDIVAVVQELEAPDVLPAAAPPHRGSRRTWRELRDALSPRGPILLHAVRVSLLAVIAMTIGRTLTPAHPTWVPVTALAVLQPYLGATVVRAAERVIGTILGAAVALVLMTAVHSHTILAVLLFPLCVVAVMTRPRSYRLFVLFLTPVFLLITDPRNANWHAAAARILDVGLGGVLAFVAAIIAPSHERPRLADALEGVLATLAHYTELAAAQSSRAEIVAARRTVGVALERAEASLERMLSEPPPLRHGAEPAMYVVTYARRLSASVTDLLENGGSVSTEVAAYVAAVLDHVRAHLAGHADPAAPRAPQVASPAVASVVRRAELLAGNMPCSRRDL
jgi:uncharacterized membrane protein YccC